MSVPANSQLPIVFQALYRLEAESLAIHNRQELVSFFCLQIIPFLIHHSGLIPLWGYLRVKYEELIEETKTHERNAISEIKKAFRQVERDLRTRQSISHELELRLEEARSVILKNRFRSIIHPLFRIYDEEFRSLLQLLLKTGFRDICEKYAELIDLAEYVQKDHSEKERWGILNDEWKIEKIVSSDEVSEHDKLSNSRFYCIRPEMILVKIPHIRLYTFAPSTSKAWTSSQQTHWDHSYNPAVIWQYFEAALSCWNTPSSHFEKKIRPPKTTAAALEFWRQSSEYSVWKEISRAKEDHPTNDHAVIFTEQLFKKGFKTLINIITVFLASSPLQVPNPIECNQEISLELFWYRGQLWISIDSEISKEKFCVQKFYDSGFPGGSEPEKFCKKLVETSSQERKFPCRLEFDKIAHVLDRLKIPKILKKLYFGTTHGNTVDYMGPKLRLMQKIAHSESWLAELRNIHQANGDPVFHIG